MSGINFVNLANVAAAVPALDPRFLVALVIALATIAAMRLRS